MPNTHSYRVIQDKHHLLLLDRLKWAYTTSANLSNKAYDETFAKEMADILITPLSQNQEASKIYKLGKNTFKRISYFLIIILFIFFFRLRRLPIFK